MEDSQSFSEKMFLPSSLSVQPSTVKALLDRGAILTNDQICELIAARVDQYRLTREYALFNQTDSQLIPKTSTSPSTVVSLPQTSSSNRDKGHKLTAGKSPEEDTFRTEKSSSETDKKGTLGHRRNLSEDSPIHSDVAFACEKDERSPVVTATISTASCDELESSLTECGSASQKDQFQLDGDKTVDDEDGETEIGQQQKRDAAKEGRMAASTKDLSSKDQQGSNFILKRQCTNFMPPQAKCFFVEDDQSDEESDDEWEVIPIDILDIKFEPAETYPASANVVQEDSALEHHVDQGGIQLRQSCVLKPVPASAFSKMAVFDTPDDQEQAIRSGQLSFVLLSCGSPKAKPTGTEGCSEHEHSCDTDNSSIYSSGPECNYMTVPKELFKNLSSADNCVPENKREMPSVLEKFLSRIEQDDGIINLDSDEDNNEHCKTKAKKRLSQMSENWSDPSPSLQMGFPKDVESESEEESSKDNYVIILSDSEDESRENYNAENIFTPYYPDCGRAGSSGPERNTVTPKVERAHMSKHDHKNQKSSRPKVSSQWSTRKVMSSEAEDVDDFPNESENVLVPQRKNQKTSFHNPRLSSEADSTVSSSVIPCVLVEESKSDEPVTLFGETRNPSQGCDEAIPMARPSLKKWQLFIKERAGNPASIPSHANASSHTVHASSSHSSDNPAALDRTLIHGRILPSSMSVQSMPATSHARNKVFSDWKRQHVPLRREKKKRTKVFRRPR